MLTATDAERLERCIAAGGLALFPADTVYGLACRPDSEDAVARLYALKGRRPDKPAAVMFFALELALASIPELGPRTVAALGRLMPGGITALVANRARRFPLACGPDPRTLGLRVPGLGPALAALADVRRPLLQTSANLAGAADPRRLAEVSEPIRAGVDLMLDAGDLPGTPSTVVDLRRFEDAGEWAILREGAVPGADVAGALAGGGPSQ